MLLLGALLLAWYAFVAWWTFLFSYGAGDGPSPVPGYFGAMITAVFCGIPATLVAMGGYFLRPGFPRRASFILAAVAGVVVSLFLIRFLIWYLPGVFEYYLSEAGF